MRAILWLSFLSIAAAGCQASLATTGYVSNVPGVTSERLLIATDQPVLFLGPEHDAPAIGYASEDLLVKLAGNSKEGRVPVRVQGPLEVRAHVPEAILTLRVQRRGRLRDTPVYVGPNDRVRVLGPATDPGRVRIAASPLIIGHPSLSFEGTYPAVGVSTQKAPADSVAPDAGAPYELAPGLPLVLCEAPNGKVVASLPARPLALEVAVLRTEGEWLAVRIGHGPYLVGYTNAALKAKVAGASGKDEERKPRPTGALAEVPERLLREQGELKRVVSGARVRFNDETIAILHTDGWARVLAEYPNGEVDVFVAVDNRVAVRGLLPKSALRDGPLSETPSRAATP